MNLQKIIFFGVVMVILSACGEDSTSSSSTQEESVVDREVTSEEVSQREELSIEEEEEIVTEGNIWNVSTVAEFRQALEDASANGDHDTIVLDAGVYKTTSDGLGTFKFNDDEPFNLTIKAREGLKRDKVVLNGDHATQVFHYYNEHNSTLKLNGISIIDGNSSSLYHFGGFDCIANVKIEDCNISNNSPGGFYAGNTIINNSIVSNNINGSGFHSHRIVMNNSIVYNNSSYQVGGGFSSNLTAKITNSLIYNNKSQSSGGGFYSYGSTTLIKSKVFNNYASGYGGGFKSVKDTTIAHSSLFGNKSGERGGAFYADGDIIVVTNSIFSKNNANIGSAFYASYLTDSYLINNDFQENTSQDNLFQNNCAVYLNSGILINNIFKKNGKRTIILNGNTKIYNNYIDYTEIIESHNIIKKHNLQPSSVGDIYLNSDNRTLSSNSPVINKGLNPNSTTFRELFNNDDIYNQVVELLSTDIDGKPRVVNGTIDMGASERQ